MAVTWNPADKGAGVDLSNGNMSAEANATGTDSVRATNSKASGKWYWEVKIDVDADDHVVGIGTSGASITEIPGYDAYGYGYNASMGEKGHGNTWDLYGDDYTTNDIIGIALDLDNGKIWFAKNNVWQNSGNPTAGTNPAYTGLSGTFFPMHSPKDYPDPDPADKATARFLASDQTYSPPSGFTDFDANPSGVGLLDGKVRIKSSATDNLDGKLGVNVAVDLLDGKANVKSATADLLDGRLEINSPTDLFDGKVRLEFATTKLLDGKVKVHKVATNLLSGALLLHPFFTGELELPSLTLEAFTGHQGSIELPFLEVLGMGSVGRLGWLEENLPRFSLEARTGLVAAAILPSLSIESIAYLELLGKGNCVLPGFNVNATTLIEILANAGVSLPSLRLEAGFQQGIIASGNVNLYPLRLHASGFAGIVGTVDVSLPGLLVDGSLVDNPDCIGTMKLPYFIVDVDGNVTRDPCLGPYILKHRR